MVVCVENLNKVYRVPVREGGFLGTIEHLLRPRYREIHALRDISFQIGRGELVGYLGPNGAGKSTSLKILTGTLLPTSGTVYVCGLRPHADRRSYVRRIGALFGQRSHLWWDLPVIDSYRMLANIYEVPPARLEAKLSVLDEGLGISSYLNRPVRQLSLGERMRCELAATLLHDPEVLFLDEPTIGLDISAKHGMRTFLKRVNREMGVTIMLASHDLADVERLCNRVIVIDKGRCIFDGSLAALRERFPGRRLAKIRFEVPPSPVAVAAGLQPLLEEDGVWEMTSSHDLVIQLPHSCQVGWLVDTLGRVARIADLTLEEPRVEDILRTLYESGVETSC